MTPSGDRRELLGEALLECGKPEEALVAFEASLALSPSRFNGVYGAARAAEATGREAEAQRYYEQLVALAGPGDGTRPEIAEAQEYLSSR